LTGRPIIHFCARGDILVSAPRPDTFCNGYAQGYSNGWNNIGPTNIDPRLVSSNSEGAAIGGNKINGDNNVVNQQIIQQQNTNSAYRHFTSDNNNNDNNDGSSGDSSGQLPRCKAFCLGVQ
jgi:hypothetical protein